MCVKTTSSAIMLTSLWSESQYRFITWRVRSMDMGVLRGWWPMGPAGCRLSDRMPIERPPGKVAGRGRGRSALGHAAHRQPVGDVHRRAPDRVAGGGHVAVPRGGRVLVRRRRRGGPDGRVAA